MSSRFKYLIAVGLFCLAVFPVTYSTAGPDGFDKSVNLTATERQWLKNHPVIRVAPDPDYPPIESFDKNDNLTGISTSYLQLLNEKLGIKFDVKRLPSWDAVIGAAKSRDIDMLSAATETTARTKYMSFTRPHIELPGVIIVQENKKQFTTLKSLHGKKVGVVSNYVWQEWVTRDHPSIKLQPVRDLQTGLLLVSFGQLDAMVANLATASYYIKKMGVTNLSVAGETGYFARLAIASRKDWPILHSILEKTISSISPEQHKNIVSRWIGLSTSKTLDTSTILVSTLIILAVTVLIIGGNLFWNYSLRQRVRRQSETLRESEERYRKIVDLSPDAVFICADRKFILCNNAFLNQIGADSFDDLRGKQVDDLIYPDDRHILTARREALRAGTRKHEVIEIRRLRLDGSVYHTEVAAAPMTWKGNPAIQVVCRDISKRKLAEAAALAAQQEAELANRAKTEFLANMSHELRTPLNAIIGFSEIINQETLGPVGMPSYKEYAGDIHSAGKHLLAVINDVLDISKIEAGHVELREDHVDLTNTIHDCVPLIKERAAQKNIALKLELADFIPLIHADHRRLKQILINLLSNAIKFTEPGGDITIRAWFDAQFGYQIQVADTGIGMAPEDIPKALSRFQQIDGTLGRQQDGTGLGLPLTKSLIELHGGTLNIDSEVGVGTTVSINFMPERAVANSPPQSRAAE